jgi:hypothetical protein
MTRGGSSTQRIRYISATRMPSFDVSIDVGLQRTEYEICENQAHLSLSNWLAGYSQGLHERRMNHGTDLDTTTLSHCDGSLHRVVCEAEKGYVYVGSMARNKRTICTLQVWRLLVPKQRLGVFFPSRTPTLKRHRNVRPRIRTQFEAQ